MTFFWYSVIGLIFWAAVLSIVCIWSRQDTKGRSAAIALFLISIPAIFGLFSQTLGNPRPYTWEQLKTFKNVDYLILGYKIDYEKAIYIYLNREGEPLSLVLEWNQETAQELQDVMKEVGPEGRGIMTIPRKFEHSLDENSPQFHALPQQKFLPDKIIEEPEVLERGA